MQLDGYLQRIIDVDALLGTEVAMVGSLFESLVTLSVRVFAQNAESRIGHLRLHGGRREVDLIVDCLVIHTGPEAYRRKDGIAVVPAALLGP